MANEISTQQAVSQAYTAQIKPYSAEAAATKSSSDVDQSTQTAAASKSDSTSLSSTSNLISQALGGSDVRTEKVAALQQSIAAGTYNVSSSDVASKMVDSLLG